MKQTVKQTVEPEWKQWRHIRYSRYKELLCILNYYVKIFSPLSPITHFYCKRYPYGINCALKI